MDLCSKDGSSSELESEKGHKALSDALRGHVHAQLELAAALEEEHDLELAAAWFKKAAMQDHAESAFRAGLLCLSNPKTVDECAYWFHKAACMGHDKAQFNLADLYEHGIGVKVDPEA